MASPLSKTWHCLQLYVQKASITLFFHIKRQFIMKTLLSHPNCKAVGLFLFLICHPFLTITAQNLSDQKEYFGEEASEIIPGALYVLEGKNTPFPAFVKFDQEKTIPLSEFFTWLRSLVSYDSNIDFKLLKMERDEIGIEHYNYVQTYKGKPVDLTWYYLHVKEEQVVSFNGFADLITELDINPLINESNALIKALKMVNAKKYRWEEPLQEAQLKKHKKDPNATYYPKGELVITKEAFATQKRYVPAWRFDIRESENILDQTIYINASSGEKVKSYSLVLYCDPGSAATTWNGTQTIQTDMTAPNNFILFDDCSATTISTVMEAGLTEYNDADNNWVEVGLTGPATTHFHARVTMDYYLAIHGRDSYDDAGGNIRLEHRVGWANASYSGGGEINIGENSGLDAEFYNTLDVIAHEFTHGVVDNEANLVYQGESGALNESFADILGETCERWFENNMNIDWLHREDYVGGNNRSFINPNDNSHPDTYLGMFWASTGIGDPDEGGVHTNSGVQNHWFYLLSEGGSGTNDNGDDYTVCGIGLANARSIAYTNLTVYLGVNSNYNDARAGAISAAEDLFGVGSDEADQVANAWYAVGVGTGAAAFSVACPPADLGTIACNDPIPLAATNQPEFEALGASINGLICAPISVMSIENINPPLNICGGQTLTHTYTISDGTSTEGCVQTLTIAPPPAPTIICPADVTISCDDSDNPSATGMANASTLCGPAPDLNYSDMVVAGNCNWECTTERTWTAQDHCGNTNSCIQRITSTPLMLIQQALATDIVIGLPGVSLTLTLADAECIVEWLSDGFGNGSPAAIPWGNHFNNPATCLPGSILINPDGTMANPLLAAQIFMAINLRLNPALGDMLLSDTGVPVDMVLIISMRRNPTVSDLYKLTNIALGNIYAPHLDFLTQSVQGINEAFSFCMGGVGSIVESMIDNSGDIFEASGFNVNNFNLQNDFYIYPNPARNEVYFDLSAYAGRSAIVEIYNLQGQLIVNQKIEEIQDSPVLFNLHNFNDAIYMGVVHTDGEQSKSRKFLVKK